MKTLTDKLEFKPELPEVSPHDYIERFNPRMKKADFPIPVDTKESEARGNLAMEYTYRHFKSKEKKGEAFTNDEINDFYNSKCRKVNAKSVGAIRQTYIKTWNQLISG
jgi:hypothetical protein